MRTALIKGLWYCLAWVPLPYLQRFSVYLAGLFYTRSLRAVNTCKQNIALCYPDKNPADHALLVRASLAHSFMGMLELGHIWLRPLAYSLSLIKYVENQALVEQYQGQAVIFLTPHFGAWELAGLYVGHQQQLTSLYKPPKLAGMAALLCQLRERGGGKMVPTTPYGVRQIFRALKTRAAVGILPDQEPRQGSGVFSAFMGQDAYTMTLIYRLLQKTGAKVLLAYAQRLDVGYKLVYQQPPAAIYADDEADAVAALNQAIEACIKTCPEQYLWTYKRFKYRPPGQASIYD